MQPKNCQNLKGEKRMDDKHFSSFEKKLDTIIRLLAIQILSDKEFREQIRLLHKIGFQPKEIALLTGKTVNNVTVTLHLIRKEKKKETKGGK